MSHLTDKVSYIRGLMEGMKLDYGTNEGKLFEQILQLLGEMADEIETIHAVTDELNEYVEDIDEDLGDLEESMGLADEEGEEEGEDEEDFDFDELDEEDEEPCDGDCEACDEPCDDFEDADAGEADVYVECMCPSCKGTFYVLEKELGEGVFHTCPRCGERIHVEPDYDEEVPIAKLADQEPQE